MRRAILIGQILLVGCGSRTDLGGAEGRGSTSSDDGGGSVAAFACKPGDPMVELFESPDLVDSPIATDGAWVYGESSNGTWSVAADGSGRVIIDHEMLGFVLADEGGLFYNGKDSLDWILHDGSERHVVLPDIQSLGLLSPPFFYGLVGYSLREYSIVDGTNREVKFLDLPYYLPPNYLDGLTDRYVHIQVQSPDLHFIDYRVVRTDGSLHAADFTLPSNEFSCDSGLVAPNAYCGDEHCALDERDDFITLPIPHACVAVVDEQSAYYPGPNGGLLRVGLRTNKVDLLQPELLRVNAAAEGAGCIFASAILGINRVALVRFPR